MQSQQLGKDIFLYGTCLLSVQLNQKLLQLLLSLIALLFVKYLFKLTVLRN